VRGASGDHGEGFVDAGALVEHGHEGAGDAGGAVVLDDIAAVDDAVDALVEEIGGALEDGAVVDLAAATDEDGDAAGDLNDLVVEGGVIGGVGLDDIGAELDGLADEVGDLGDVAIDHVATGDGIGLEHQGLDHHGHLVIIGLGFEFEDVIDALRVDIGRAGDLEEIDADADRIEAHGLEHRVLNHGGEACGGEVYAVDIRDVGAQDEGGLVLAWEGLEVASLADGELDGVGAGLDQGLDGGGHRLDTGEEAWLVEEAVVYGDVEAAVGGGMEEAIEAHGDN
jgi:hypothetical protein